MYLRDTLRLPAKASPSAHPGFQGAEPLVGVRRRPPANPYGWVGIVRFF